jgi:hypothetical protein
MNIKKVVVVGIAGKSGVGKDYLVNELRANINGLVVPLSGEIDRDIVFAMTGVYPNDMLRSISWKNYAQNYNIKGFRALKQEIGSALNLAHGRHYLSKKALQILDKAADRNCDVIFIPDIRLVEQLEYLQRYIPNFISVLLTDDKVYLESNHETETTVFDSNAFKYWFHNYRSEANRKVREDLLEAIKTKLKTIC